MIWPLILLACTSKPGDSAQADPGDPFQPDPASAEEGWLRGDLHFHTNYSDDALEQGGDWMGPALDIADAYQDSAWTEAFPETARDRLHFVAVTDHRTTAGLSDPDFGHENLVVIGGGYIGLELGIMYHHLGSKVTVLEATKGALPGQERDCIKVIERSLKKRKVKLMTETFAKGWERTADGLSVTVEGKTGISTVECDQILSTVGRRPYSEGLGLESAGLSVNEQGFLDTDRQMRTSVPNIYAIGDIAGQPMLAHKGSKEGVVAAAVIAGQPEEYDAKCVPAVVFTAPEMASVGLTEEQCKEQGLDYATGSFPFAASGRAMTLMETEGLVKVIADAKTDELLGVHMVGPEVTELIAEATLALEMGATAEDIARTVHAHPTLPEAFMEAAEAVHGMAVHIYQRS